MNDFDFLPNLIKKAFNIILDVYQKDFSIEYKGRYDPVTEADKRVDTMLIEKLEKLSPKSYILTEESYKKSDIIPDTFWCIDPLDGTKDFIQKNGEFCTMMAYIEDNKPIAGIIGIPVSGMIFTAERGKGAFYLKNGQKEKILLDNKDIDSERIIAIHSRNHQNKLLFHLLDRLNIKEQDRITRGSVGCKVSAILKGEADLYIHPSRHTKWWDSASGEIILGEAGGSFTDLYNHRINYKGNNVFNEKGILASSFKDNDFLSSITCLYDNIF